MQRMLFVDRQIFRGSVDLACRSVNDLLDSARESRLTNVQGPANIRFQITVRSPIRIWDRNERGEMEDHVDLVQQSQTKMAVPDIAAHNLDLAKRRNVLKP